MHRSPDTSLRSSAAVEAARVDWIRSQQAALWRYLRLLGARADEVEDLMQDAFVALFSRYPDEEPLSQVRLLRTIARRRFLEQRRRRVDATAWSDAVDGWLAENPRALDDGSADAVGACLQELTARAREGLTLRHVDGQPVERVAEALGLQRTGALSLLQRTRDLLRACLERRGVLPAGAVRAANDTPSSSSVSPT